MSFWENINRNIEKQTCQYLFKPRVKSAGIPFSRHTASTTFSNNLGQPVCCFERMAITEWDSDKHINIFINSSRVIVSRDFSEKMNLKQ